MNSPRRVRLFFFSTLFTTFIRVDKEILEKHFTVDLLIDRGFTVIPRLFFRVLRNDIALVWFASVYAFFVVVFCRILKKPSMVVVAGVDAAKDAEIHYGIWLNPWKAKLVQYVFRHADRVLVVDPFLEQEAKRLADYEGKNITYIPFGFDSDFWRPRGAKESFILTVASCENIWRLRKKGIDKLLEAAREVPETSFVIIGIQPKLVSFHMKVPPNVTVLPFVEQIDLLRYYQRSKVYCQVSYTEGLPNALCEAMLCGCIPVGTQRGGIPTAIDGVGILIPYGDVQAMVKAFRKALLLSPERGSEAREWIVNNFPMKRREDALLRIIEEPTI